MSSILEDYETIYFRLVDKSIELQTFDNISTNLQKDINKSQLFNYGTFLTMLVHQNDLPDFVSKLGALYVIYDFFNTSGTGKTNSPYAAFFYHRLRMHETRQGAAKVHLIEYNYIVELLKNGTIKLAKQTPATVINTDFLTGPPDLQFIKIAQRQRKLELPVTVTAGIMNATPAVSYPTEDEAGGIRNLLEALALSESTPITNTLNPEFITPPPPLMPFDDEPIWLHLTCQGFHQPIHEAATTTDVKGQAKKLAELALKQALSLLDQQVLLEELKKNPSLVHEIGLTPEKVLSSKV